MKKASVILFTVSILLLTTLVGLVPGTSSQGPPPTPELKGESAQDYLERGTIFANTVFDTAAALSDLSKAIELDPTLMAAYIERGRLYRSIDAFDLARDDFAAVLEMNPDSEEALLGRARYHIAIARKTNFVQAQADIDRVLELNPDSLDAIIAQGELYISQDLYDEAYEQFSLAVNVEPENVVALDNRVNAGILMATTPNTFVSDLEAFLVAADGHPSLYGWQTYDYYRRNQTDQAMTPCNEGLPLFPNHAPLLDMCTGITATVSRNPEGALSLIERAIELAPMSPRFHVTRGIQLRTAFRSEEAAAEFKTALDLQPGYVPAINQLIQFYLFSARTQDCDQAAIYTEMAQNSLPETVNEENNLNDLNYALSYRCGSEEVWVDVENPTFETGTVVLVPGVVMYSLGKEPGELQGGTLCTSGSEATVLQSVRLDTGEGPVWVEIECESGTGWIPETLIE